MPDPLSGRRREPDGLTRLLADPFHPANAAINEMLRSGAAGPAVTAYLRHPSDVPGGLFNDAAADLDATAAAAAFRNWRRVLERMADRGRFADITGLHAVGVGVLNMLAWHHSLLSRRRTDPRMADGRRRYMTGVDLTRFAVSAADPAAAADRFTTWRRVARAVGRARFRLAVLCLRAAAESGRRVVPTVARWAVVDAGGRVIGFRLRLTPPADGPASKGVTAQVRSLCHDALVAVQVAAGRLGYDALPGV